MLLAFGIAAALLEASKSGRGQVVDAAMVDGAATLMTLVYAERAAGLWEDTRASNVIDGGAPFYGVYRCKDGKFVAVGAIEPKFYALLVAGLGLDEAALPDRWDRANWPAMRETFAAAFAANSRDGWSVAFAGTDACVAPVLNLDEAPRDLHMAARAIFVTVDGIAQPAPAPRFSRTPGAIARAPATPGQHSAEVLTDWGFSADEIAALKDSGAAA
jgi:alpha-methylacyl-CoA racemase